MAGRRRQGKEYYGAGKLQRRKQLQLARASKSKDASSAGQLTSASSAIDSMAASVTASVTPSAQV